MERRLHRSRQNRVLLGVCGGFGEYFDIDPVIVRVIAILLMVLGIFPAIIAYFILAIIIPIEGSNAATPRDSFQENIDDMKKTVRPAYQNVSRNALLWLGIAIIAIGVFLIIADLFNIWRFLWPTTLIIAGLLIILLVARQR